MKKKCRIANPSIRNNVCKSCEHVATCTRVEKSRNQLLKTCKIKYNCIESIPVICYNCPARFLCPFFSEL